MVYCSVASTDLQAHSTTAIQCDAYGQVSPFSNYTGSEPAIVHILTRKPAHKIRITTRVSCIQYISSTVQTGGVGDHLILKIFRGFREIMPTGRASIFFEKRVLPAHFQVILHLLCTGKSPLLVWRDLVDMVAHASRRALGG